MKTILKGALIIFLVLMAGVSMIRIDACHVQVKVVSSDEKISLEKKEYIVKMLEGHASVFKFLAVLATISIPVVLFLTRKKITVQGGSKK